MSSKKPYFEPVDPKVDFPSLEREILDFWHKKGIVKKYLSKNPHQKKYFSFLDGPITANNPMGVHHAWGRTYKDLWQRFKNMQGFRQRFQNGFDCQGLWVEVEVEKQLGLKSKKEIENLVPGDKKASIAKFVELCKERVFKYAGIQTEQSKRLGYFMDWDNSYYTLSDENNYTIWHFLKKCHEKGLIYKGRDSVPWCPRCGTAISQHEMLTEDYGEIIHDAIYVKYPLKNSDESLLVWTTTPWTLPANVAIAVNPKFKYRVWQNTKTKEKIIFVRDDAAITPRQIAKQVLTDVIFDGEWRETETEYSGDDLIGKRYRGPFDNLPKLKGVVHQVIPAPDLVNAEEGTGLVHIAPGAGEEDFKLGKELNLGVIEVIDESANYLDGLNEFSGRNAKDDPGIIFDYLKVKERGKYFFKLEKYKHRYPVCWRCKTELVWRVVDEWYIAMDKPSKSKIKNRSVAKAMERRRQKSKSLREEMKDTARKINWIPKFGLERELDWLSNMHDWLISKKRYWGLALPIWECKKCGHFEVLGGYEELKEKAQSGWKDFEGHTPHRPWIDEVKIKCDSCQDVCERIPDVGNPWLDAGIVPFSTMPKKWFPADFITESFPGQFKNWFYSLIAMGTVLQGKEPTKTILGFATLLAEDARPMHKSWGNSIEFNEAADNIGVDVIRWMYTSQNPAENLLFGYKLASETRKKFHLILWNVYNFFVTYANLDSWKPNQQSTINNQQSTILDKWILSRLNQTLADVTNSLEIYDAFAASKKIENFVSDLSLWYIRRSRSRVGPGAATTEDRDAFYQSAFFVLVTLSKMLAPFTPFLAESIYRNLTKEASVHLSNWPRPVEIGAEDHLTQKMELVRKISEIGHAIRKGKRIKVRQPLSRLVVENSPLKLDGFTQILSDELNVKEVKVDLKKSGRELGVELDAKLTPALVEEGKARELIRKIQEERKEKKLDLTVYVLVENPWVPKSKSLLDWIRKKTLAKSITRAKSFKLSNAAK